MEEEMSKRIKEIEERRDAERETHATIFCKWLKGGGTLYVLCMSKQKERIKNGILVR